MYVILTVLHTLACSNNNGCRNTLYRLSSSFTTIWHTSLHSILADTNPSSLPSSWQPWETTSPNTKPHPPINQAWERCVTDLVRQQGVHIISDGHKAFKAWNMYQSRPQAGSAGFIGTTADNTIHYHQVHVHITCVHVLDEVIKVCITWLSKN